MKLKCREPSQLLYSLKLGDGCFVTQCKDENNPKPNYYLMATSINLDYISHKKSQLDKLGVTTQPLHTGKSGYKDTSIIYSFGTRNHYLISVVGNMRTIDILNSLNVEGLIYLFLDDGTYHQKKHFGHIYCNTFSDEEVETLIDVIYKFYPQKRCVKRIDRKKDGRQYPYIYIPVAVMNEFKKDIQQFLEENNISSLKYKVGGDKCAVSSL